jgi:hypothetical protein
MVGRGIGELRMGGYWDGIIEGGWTVECNNYGGRGWRWDGRIEGEWAMVC